MKTLVIHPVDSTTDFLCPIYEDIEDCTVIRDVYSISPLDLIRMVQKHDRIWMMGHGLPSGLLSRRGICIHEYFVPFLEDKECVYIWCNANMFVEKYELQGFYTGMVISEVMEARFYQINVDQAHIDNSNQLYAQTVKAALQTDDPVAYVQEHYIDEEDPVIMFNRERVYYRVNEEAETTAD